MRNCVGVEGAGEHLAFPFAPELRQCPWAAVPPAAWQLHSIWERWRRLGVLPAGCAHAGELPNPIAEAFVVCDQAAEDMRELREAERAAKVEGALSALAGLGRRE
jgi:hypothetical protein